MSANFDKTLSFSQHLTLKVSEAMKSYGFLVLNFRNFINTKSLEVHLVLKYATIGDLQRTLLKLLVFETDGIYTQRGVTNNCLCNRINIISLDNRRICSSFIFWYKILQNQIDCVDLLCNVYKLHYYISR